MILVCGAILGTLPPLWGQGIEVFSFFAASMNRRGWLLLLCAMTAAGCRGSGGPVWTWPNTNPAPWNAPAANPVGWNANPAFPATNVPSPQPMSWRTGIIPPPATGSYIPSPPSPTSLAGPPPAGLGYGFSPTGVPAGNPSFNPTAGVNPTPGFTPPTIDPTTGLATNTPQVSPYWNNPATNPAANYGAPAGYANGWNQPTTYPNYNASPYNANGNNPLVAWSDRLRGAFSQGPGSWLNPGTNNGAFANNGYRPGVTQGWSYPQGSLPPGMTPGNYPAGNYPQGNYNNESPRVGWNDRGGTARNPAENYAPEPPVRIPDAALAGDVNATPRRPAPLPSIVANPPARTTPPISYPAGNGTSTVPMTNTNGGRATDWIEITQLPRRRQ